MQGVFEWADGGVTELCSCRCSYDLPCGALTVMASCTAADVGWYSIKLRLACLCHIHPLNAIASLTFLDRGACDSCDA